MQSQHLHISLIHADHQRQQVLADAAQQDLVRQALAGQPSQLAQIVAAACHAVGSAMVGAGQWLQQRQAEARSADAAGCGPVGSLTVR